MQALGVCIEKNARKKNTGKKHHIAVLFFFNKIQVKKIDMSEKIYE